MKNNIRQIILLALIIAFVTGCQKSIEPSTISIPEESLFSKIRGKHIYYGKMKDNDGKVYRTVQIGNKIWMAENLRSTRYRNGDLISRKATAQEWASQGTVGAWCYYDNDFRNDRLYGKLYNCYVIEDPRGIAPAGWRVPSYSDLVDLGDALGGAAIAGGAMKTTGTIESHKGLWYAPNTGASNSSGFSALPSGLRNAAGAFEGKGTHLNFWTSTLWDSYLDDNGIFQPLFLIGQLSSFDEIFLNASSDIDWMSYSKPYGLSIRLVRDKNE